MSCYVGVSHLLMSSCIVDMVRLRLWNAARRKTSKYSWYGFVFRLRGSSWHWQCYRCPDMLTAQLRSGGCAAGRRSKFWTNISVFSVWRSVQHRSAFRWCCQCFVGDTENCELTSRTGNNRFGSIQQSESNRIPVEFDLSAKPVLAVRARW